MEVFIIKGNPMPHDPIVSAVRTRDGLRLRVARWTSPNSRGTVTIATGRAEFIENYYEMVRDLLERRYDVVVFDWRGQGQSDREIAARHRGYVSSFAAYQRDLLAIEGQILRMFAPRPWFAFGHSMGAAVLLEQAHHGTSPFDRLVLSAPMIDVAIRHKRVKRAAVRALDTLGFGRQFIPGGSPRPMFLRGFADNVLTSDWRQFTRLSDLATQLPALVIGSPTIRWTASAFDVMERFEDPRYSVATVMPILIVAAGSDRLVDTAAIERFAIRLKAGRCITIPGARHQIFMERPEVIAQFWAAFDAFVPGETEQADDPVVQRRDPRRTGLAGALRRFAGRLGRRPEPAEQSR